MGRSAVGKAKATPGPRYSDRAPHDPRTDVKLAGDWLDRWLGHLDQEELRAYLQLAHFYNTRTYHDREALELILGGRDSTKALRRLERRGLIEVIEKQDQSHYHFPFRDSDGYHRGQRARPSLAEALAFQQRMTEELTVLTEQDETDDLRERFFERYPELLEEHDLYHLSADATAPRWRLWMEVGNLLIREFEDRYGSLREDHGALFKEVSAQVLTHHLELVDGVVGHVLERLEQLFPEVHDDWVIAPDREAFVALPFIRQQGQRYGVGPEQILINVIEALGQHGRVVCSIDEAGSLSNMILPADTGLTKSEERVLFLKPEERAQQDSPRNRERVRRARNKYANYLIERACLALADFVTAGRVQVVDAWLDRIVDEVNDALELLPMEEGERPVKLEHVIDAFDGVRQGRRMFAAPGALPSASQVVRRRVEATRAAVSRTSARPKTAHAPVKPKAAKKKVAQKKVATKKAATKKAATKKAATKKAAKKKAAKKKAAKKKAATKKAAQKKVARRR